MQILEVNVPLIDVEIRTSANPVFIATSIAVTCVEDSIGPECLGTWVGLDDNVTNRPLCYSVSMLVSSW